MRQPVNRNHSTMKLCHHMSSVDIPIFWVIRSDGDGRWLPGHWPGYGRDAGKAEPVISSYQCQGRDRLQSAMLHSCGSVIRSFRSTVSKRCAFSAYMSHLFYPYFEQLNMNFNMHAFVASRQNIAFSRVAHYESRHVRAKPLETPLAF